jgi:hypothetical protein
MQTKKDWFYKFIVKEPLSNECYIFLAIVLLLEYCNVDLAVVQLTNQIDFYVRETVPDVVLIKVHLFYSKLFGLLPQKIVYLRKSLFDLNVTGLDIGEHNIYVAVLRPQTSCI